MFHLLFIGSSIVMLFGYFLGSPFFIFENKWTYVFLLFLGIELFQSPFMTWFSNSTSIKGSVHDYNIFYFDMVGVLWLMTVYSILYISMIQLLQFVFGTNVTNNFNVSDRCVVHHLETEAGQLLNGQHVTLKAKIPNERFKCRFDDGTFKQIKTGNLQIIDCDRINQTTGGYVSVSRFARSRTSVFRLACLTIVSYFLIRYCVGPYTVSFNTYGKNNEIASRISVPERIRQVEYKYLCPDPKQGSSGIYFLFEILFFVFSGGSLTKYQGCTTTISYLNYGYNGK